MKIYCQEHYYSNQSLCCLALSISSKNQPICRCITVPQPADDDGQSVWIVLGVEEKVLNAPGYPARIPKPRHPDLYEIRSTPDMGLGIFAKRNIKRGELIFSERPLLVSTPAMATSEIPQNFTPKQHRQIIMADFERTLEAALGRMTNDDQASYRTLPNSHQDDGSGPLYGIMRTNGYALRNLIFGDAGSHWYSAICKVASRINHRHVLLPSGPKSFTSTCSLF